MKWLRNPRPAGAQRTGNRTLRSTKASPGLRPDPGSLILLAEDSRVTRIMVRTWLERSGQTVVEAQDGQEAWERFSQGPDRGRIGLLLTDVMMPRMDGLELARRVRELDPDMPIGVLTSNSDQETADTAFNLGVDVFLNKPFEVQELAHCLERLLAAREQRQRARRTRESAAGQRPEPGF